MGKSTRCKKVAQYTLDGKLVKVWNSVSAAAASFGAMNCSGISKACKGAKHVAYGFIWRYFDDVQPDVKIGIEGSGKLDPGAFSLIKFNEDKGRPIYTRNGDRARILATGVKLEDSRFSVIGLVTRKNGTEEVHFYTEWGLCDPECEQKSPFDLRYKPVKKTGWLNIYHGALRGSKKGGFIFDTKKAAERSGVQAGSTAVVQIEWEE